MMEEKIWFVENNGKRRSGFYKDCSACGNRFISPLRYPYDCCSLKCKNKFKTLKKNKGS
jgi:hypothetical protein